MVYLVPRAHPPFSTIPFGNGGSLPILVEKEAGASRGTPPLLATI